MEQDYLISVIVPIYNIENYLDECIESIKNQTYTNLEIILVDDGSSDRCGDICNRHATTDKRITVIHRPNGGLSQARNSGLDAAHGEYIIFVDGDDIIHPEFAQQMLSLCLNNNADIASSDFNCFISGSPIPKLPTKAETIVYHNPTNAIADALYRRNIDNSVCAKIYKRYIFDNIRFKPSIGYEDLQIFYRLFERANKIVFEKSGLYFYRQHPDSYLGKFSLKRTDVLDVTDELFDYMTSTGNTELIHAAADRRLSANFNILWLMQTSSVCNKEVEQRCLSNIKHHRLNSLFNKKVKLKNRLAIIASLISFKLLKLIFRHIKRQPHFLA